MEDELRTEVEQVIEREDVKQALKQTSSTEPEDKPKAEAKDKLWLGTHFIILIALAAVRLVYAAEHVRLRRKISAGHRVGATTHVERNGCCVAARDRKARRRLLDRTN